VISFQHQLSFASFSWIALGDADLRFSPTLVREAHAVEEETK
jgi:hypothetical protein